MDSTSLSQPWIKVCPTLGLAAIKAKLGGAWRAWTIARSIDPLGSGAVTKKALRQELVKLGVGDRQGRRWVSQALEAGFFRQFEGKFYLAGLAKTALILDVRKIGLPALIGAHSLVSKYWRGRVWSAFLMTLHARPVSQTTKLAMTGVLPRTQQRYQAGEPGCARANFSRTNLRPDQVPGMIEVEGGAYFTARSGRVFKRLPDIRMVDSSIVQSAPEGRCRKAQKLAISFYEERDPSQWFRLFCRSTNQVRAAGRNIGRIDRLPGHKPQEIFQLLFAGRRCNLWATVPMVNC